VELASSARVEGNVYYALIEMAMGAEVNGKLVRIVEESRPPLALDHDAGFEDAEKP
jgi:cytoskeletal protein CcmA (bactofilin family)